jgi:Uma2 family endonuclease
MTTTLQRHVTREEYRRLPEGPPYYELIDGSLIEMTRASLPHNEFASAFSHLLSSHLQSGPGGYLFFEPNLYLPGTENVYHSDLVYVSPAQRGIRRWDGIYGTPHLICEILSPSTERLDRGHKLEAYRQAGVPHVWLVDPEQPLMVEEYVLGEDELYNLHATAVSPAAWEPAAFAGWRVPLAQLDALVGDLAPSEPTPPLQEEA